MGQDSIKNSDSSPLKGLLITISDDLGPRSVINLSKLNDVLAFKVALLGMTILMMGNSNPNGFTKKCNKILGPLPVPLDPEADVTLDEIELFGQSDALALIFNVKADLPTEDPRAIKNGRDAVIWFIFNTHDQASIFKLSKTIEEVTNSFIREIKLESQLADSEFFTRLLNEIYMRTSEENIVGSIEQYIPETIDYAEYTIYKYDTGKENIFPIQVLDEVKDLSLFLVIDLFEKQINIIQQQPVSRKDLFLINKSASNLNLSLKRQFIVKNINDEYEVLMYLERIGKH